MSRSYKKTPYCGDTKGKWKKRQANKKVRRHNENFQLAVNPRRSSFKKLYNSWDICDYYFISSWEEFEELTDWRYKNKKEQLKDYKKMYLYK